MSRTVRAITYLSAIALILAVVAPKVYADDNSWYFDMDSGIQYDFSTYECWLADGTAGTPQWTDENLWCETPNDILFEEWASLSSMFTEEGATFDGGKCWEADGTEGISALDGSCVTPADYDAIFSYENLSSIPVGYQWDGTEYEGISIAEVYGIAPTDEPASDRPIGTGLVESGTEKTFKQHVQSVHMPIAD